MATDRASTTRIRSRVLRALCTVVTATVAATLVQPAALAAPRTGAPVEAPASPRPITLSPEMLRALLVIREFQVRPGTVGPLAPRDPAAAREMTGDRLRDVVANVVVGLVNLEHGG